MTDKIKYIEVTPSLDQATFISFTNCNGKQWLIPLKNILTGLEIYEPSSIKGKILKKGLPFATSWRVIKGFSRFNYCNVELAGKLKPLLKSFYQNYEFSIFDGTPSTDQKVTIQIFRDREILGYCKIGTSDRIRKLFKHEKEILDLLEKSNMIHVPRCKGIFDLDHGACAFLQTTEKKTNAKIEHHFGSKHKEFLDMLFEKTKKDVVFEETDYYDSIVYLHQNIQLLQSDYQQVVAQAAESVLSSYKKRHVLWGMCHRDFTPWNTCVVNNHLFVFDFEYALRYAPPEIDRWHFFVQTLYYEKKMNATEIAHKFIDKYFDSKNIFELYLLDNISMYLMRGSPDDKIIANQKASILMHINKDL